jgi:hypothetical protein
MTNLRNLLASLFIASSLAACATGTTTHVTKPAPGHIQLDRAAVRAKLAARRQLVVSRFLAYREGRVYPVNNLPGGGLRHVWLDDFGNLCAAATLISGDWGREVAIAVGAKNREIKLADVKTGPVADWILTSGLTHHEIVAIQLPGDDVTRGFNRQPPEEIERMYNIYVDVERQLEGLWDESLDQAVDALMKRPELAREILNDRIAGPGPFAQPVG